MPHSCQLQAIPKCNTGAEITIPSQPQHYRQYKSRPLRHHRSQRYSFHFHSKTKHKTKTAHRSYDEEFDGETYHTDLFVVPFDFSFSAYEREKKAIADGVLVKDEDWSYDATANPDFHLNYTNIADGEEEDEDSIWEEAKGEISASELKFTFCFAGDNDYWSKVVATYSPNK